MVVWMTLGARVLGVAAVAERCWPAAAAPAKAKAQVQVRAEEQLQLQLQLLVKAKERASAPVPILAEWQALPWVEALAL